MLAVAGRRGAAVFDVAARRWHLFRDPQHERQFQCVAMTWLMDERVLALVSRRADNEPGAELVLLSGTRLSRSAVLASVSLSAVPVALDSGCGMLALLLADGQMVVYRIDVQTDAATMQPDGDLPVLKLHKVHQRACACRAPVGDAITSLRVLRVVPRSK